MNMSSKMSQHGPVKALAVEYDKHHYSILNYQHFRILKYSEYIRMRNCITKLMFRGITIVYNYNLLHVIMINFLFNIPMQLYFRANSFTSSYCTRCTHEQSICSFYKYFLHERISPWDALMLLPIIPCTIRSLPSNVIAKHSTMSLASELSFNFLSYLAFFSFLGAFKVSLASHCALAQPPRSSPWH